MSDDYVLTAADIAEAAAVLDAVLPALEGHRPLIAVLVAVQVLELARVIGQASCPTADELTSTLLVRCRALDPHDERFKKMIAELERKKAQAGAAS